MKIQYRARWGENNKVNQRPSFFLNFFSRVPGQLYRSLSETKMSSYEAKFDFCSILGIKRSAPEEDEGPPRKRSKVVHSSFSCRDCAGVEALNGMEGTPLKRRKLALPGHRCMKRGCSKYANFARKGSKQALYCKAHARSDMVDVKHARCQASGCSLRPSFAEERCRRPKFCKKHAGPGMRNVTHRSCAAVSCNKKASFGPKGGARPVFCKTHAPPPHGGPREPTLPCPWMHQTCPLWSGRNKTRRSL